MPDQEQTSTAARSTAGGDTSNVLNTAYETREIVLAQGIQFTNAYYQSVVAQTAGIRGEYYQYLQMPQGLQQDFPDMVIQGDQAEYVSETQRVRFKLRVVNTKDAFVQALKTPGLHVIYNGHARYGRGPCFGPGGDQPSEDWEQGAASPTGLWRMGFPIIGVPLHEIRDHGYSFYPVAAGDEEPARDQLHPDTPSRLRRVTLPDDLRAKVLGQGRPLAAEYWGYGDGEDGSLLLWAGWENTISAPMDLGATDLQCRCFCVFACSTFKHNWPILRKRKGWTRTDTDRFAYFCTSESDGLSVPCWLTALFTYPQRNDFESWYPSLQWSRDRATSLIKTKLRYYEDSGAWRII